LAVHGTPDDDSTCLLEEIVEDGRFIPARRDVLAARLGDAAKVSSRHGRPLGGGIADSGTIRNFVWERTEF
jgi:hypothetical protein